jgi:hypothetical protein
MKPNLPRSSASDDSAAKRLNKLKSNSMSYLQSEFTNKLDLFDFSSFNNSFNDSSSLSADISSDSGYLKPVYSNNSNNISSFIMPADTIQSPSPFPVPINGTLVKSRTDDTLSLLREQHTKNFYINQTSIVS